MRSNSRRVLALWLLLAGGFGAQAWGQETVPPLSPPIEEESVASGAREPWEEYAHFLSRQTTVAALGPELFGDQVNLANGTLSFAATDVDIPGNSGLPVSLRRTFAVGDHPAGLGKDLPFGDWDLDVPRISGIYGHTWQNNRCSDTNGAPNVGGYLPHDYWHGLNADMPGGGELLVANRGAPAPALGGPHRWLTPEYTYFSCLPTIKNGSGEGFLAIASDGTRYWFDWMAQYQEETLRTPMNISSGSLPLTRRKNVLYATRVEDRFGHWVTYTYTNAATTPARLTSIQASDGRLITLSYNAQNKIQSATSHGRTWTYLYEVAGNGSMTGVVLPDSSRWILNLRALAEAEVEYDGDPGPRSCGSFTAVLGGAASGSVTHPSGATGTFAVEPQRHGRTNVPKVCVNWEFPVNDRTNDVAFYVRDYHGLSLKTKTVTGPGLAQMQWLYTYSPSFSWISGCSDTQPNCPASGSPDPVCVSDSCAGSSRTTVSGPNNEWQRYTFGNSYRYNEGKLRKIERGTSASNIPHSETIGYVLSADARDYVAPIGTSLRPRGDGFLSEAPRPANSNIIVRDGATMVRNSSGFDAFARPTRIGRSSSMLYSRDEQISYYDDTASWVLGQVSAVYDVTSMTYPEQTSFDPWTALPTSRYSFGLKQEQRTYHTSAAQNGLVWQVFDGSGIKKTALDNYHRGLPRSVVFHDSSSQSVLVNDHGEITRLTDELGYATNYGRDSMGRLNQILYPTADSVPWAPKSIALVPVATAEYGLPAGHWRQTITHGNYRRMTYFDALLRPVLTREFDAMNEAGTQRFTTRKYDHAGRETFASYPEASATTWDAPTQGMRNSYDGIGRITRSEHDSELGVLATDTFYEPGFRKRVRNPRGHSTTFAFQVFDQPDDSAPVAIFQPEGVTTTIYRDLFGKPTSVIRSGVYAGSNLSQTRHFVYDVHQRLCKRVDPESGAKLFEYDDSGNLAWSVDGSSLTSLICDQGSAPVADRTTRGYDARNRLLSVDYPSGTLDVGYTWFADGAQRTVTAGTLASTAPVSWASTQDTWTYAYNKRRLLTSEQTTIEGRTFFHAYDVHGQPASLRYPSGFTTTFQPNALGQPTQVSDFVTGVQYHPNGGVSQYTYANGITRVNTQNARDLVSRARDNFGDKTIHDFEYGFDANANVQSIIDHGQAGLQNRSLGYDGLDRLVTADAPGLWGAGRYAYDPLDNLREADQGARKYRYTYHASNGRLTTIRTDTGATIWNIGHDARGNLTSKGGTSYTFDRANRLTNIPSLGATYYFDGHGRRIGQLSNLGGKYATYTQDGLLRGGSDGIVGAAVWHFYLGRQLVGTRTEPFTGAPPTHKYLHTDALGSPVAETDANRLLSRSTYYAPWGEALNGVAHGNPGYTGHAMDSDSGLIYMQQRFQDPVLGRFLSVDPVDVDATTGANFNPYRYANNSPYRFTDPDGRDAADRAYGAAVGYMLRNDPERLRIWAGGEAAATTEGSGAEAGAAMGLAIGEFLDTGDFSKEAVAGAAAKAVVLTVTRNRGPKIGPGRDFTPAQKREILKANRERNGGELRSDKSGAALVPSLKSQKGVTPASNEAQVDHKIPKSRGGTNDPSNAMVLSRKENRDKWDKTP
jgi:RHS repeat-associated protein